MRQSPREILKKYWGYENFRPLQENIIDSVLAAEDTIALLPTGGGKSICYQIPAIAQEGIAIVVSPLIALIKDQVLSLQDKGIKALSITSGIPFKELDTLLDNCIYGNYKLLYLSPERLQQELVQERIKQMNVSLIAIDEAHCISQWGHDFRPAYLQIIRLREIKPEVPIIALTATATKEVLKDIKIQLELVKPKLFQSSYHRQNLIYTVAQTSDKNGKILQELQKTQGSAILYVRNRKATIATAQFLKARGFSATSYHGGMSQDERQKNYTLWKENKAQVMVGTSAFGMGIDKQDVDTVLHLEIPDSLENYFQESGRAGRGGQAARATLVFNENDIIRLENQFLGVIPTISVIKDVYKRLNNYFQISYGEGVNETHRFNFSEFCSTYQLGTIITYNALQALERNSVISLSQEFSKRATVTFKVSDVALTYYLIKNPKVEKVVKTILRTYGGVYEQVTTINYAVLSKKSGKTLSQIHDILLLLDTDDIIDYEHTSFDTAITFLLPREDDRTIHPITPYIEEQNTVKKNQIAAIQAYIHSKDRCRSILLLKHFGENLSKPCGHCDVCLQKVGTEKGEDINSILHSFLKIERKASEINNLPHSKESIINAIQTLLEQKKIIITPNNTYKSI